MKIMKKKVKALLAMIILDYIRYGSISSEIGRPHNELIENVFFLFNIPRIFQLT